MKIVEVWLLIFQNSKIGVDETRDSRDAGADVGKESV